MPSDEMLSLAVSIHSCPGVYALLLGSGVSRAAKIPTGWEITLDLIRKIAHVEAHDDLPDAGAWYHERFGEEADYSRLLARLAPGRAERQRLLREYFEPSDDDRARGEKLPTRAHRAIAQLVKSGFIRVIVTTNFDRLMEQALEEIGVHPDVLSTPDAMRGAPPLQHSACTLLKLNGDYRDARIRNTRDELASYPAATARLLRRIFDEYGLLICGWSAEWDTALRSALERATSRRYTQFWAQRERPADEARRLATLCRAAVVAIKDADTFFVELADHVGSLEKLRRPQAIPVLLEVERLKRSLDDEQRRIDLHDMLHGHAEKIRASLFRSAPDDGKPVGTGPDLLRRLERWETESETIVRLIATGAFWGDPKNERQEALWCGIAQRIAAATPWADGNTFTSSVEHLRLYPAVLVTYAAGLAATAAEKHTLLRHLLVETEFREMNDRIPLCRGVFTLRVLDPDLARRLLGGSRWGLPLSERVEQVLRPAFREVIPDEEEYERSFDLFEYLLALSYRSVARKQNAFGQWAPIGLFARRHRLDRENSVMKVTQAEVERLREAWPPYASGLLVGSFDDVVAAKGEVDQLASDVQRRLD